MQIAKKFKGLISDKTRADAVKAIAESNAAIQKAYFKQLLQSRKNNITFGSIQKREQEVQKLLIDCKKELNGQRYEWIAHCKAKEIQKNEWEKSEEYRDHIYIEEILKECKEKEQQQRKKWLRPEQKQKEDKDIKIQDSKLAAQKKQGQKGKVQAKSQQKSNERAIFGNEEPPNFMAQKRAQTIESSNYKPTEKNSLFVPQTANQPKQIGKQSIQAPAKTQTSENLTKKVQSTPNTQFNNSFNISSSNKYANSPNSKIQSMLINNSSVEVKPLASMNTQQEKQAVKIKQNKSIQNPFLTQKQTETKRLIFFDDLTSQKKNNQTKQIKEEPKNKSSPLDQKEASLFANVNVTSNNIFSSNSKGDFSFAGAPTTTNKLKAQHSNIFIKVDKQKEGSSNIFGQQIPISSNNLFKQSTFLKNLGAESSIISSIGPGMSAILQSNRGSSINECDQLLIKQLTIIQTNGDSKAQKSEIFDRVKTSMDSSPSLFKQSQ